MVVKQDVVTALRDFINDNPEHGFWVDVVHENPETKQGGGTSERLLDVYVDFDTGALTFVFEARMQRYAVFHNPEACYGTN